MSVDAAFAHFPLLSTERLQLRQLRDSDAAALFAIKGNPLVTEPYGREPHASIEATQNLMERIQKNYEQQEGLFWCITLKGEETMIGSCALFGFDEDFLCAELGYELHPDYWRQGLTAEAVTAVLNYVFNERALHRVEANVGANNTSSRNLLLKLGFKLEGVLRQRYSFRGQFEDQHCFGLLRDEWPRSK